MKQELIGKIEKDIYGDYDDVTQGYFFNSELIDNILFQYKGKKVKLTIEVLPDEFTEKDDDIKIQVKLRAIVHTDGLCNAMGINPYCINEGADGDDLVQVPINLAKKFGLV